MLIVQRRKKLESIEREDDVHANTKRLMDEAAELNTKRFKLVIEVKVKSMFDSGILVLHVMSCRPMLHMHL